MNTVTWKTWMLFIIFTLMIINKSSAQNTVTVSTVSELNDAVNNLTNDTTILIEDGVYTLTVALQIGDFYQAGNQPLENIVIRSQSGNREAVVLEGPGMVNVSPKFIFHIFHSRNVTIQDMTLRNVWYHLIQVHGEQGADEVYMRNLHLVDANEQFIKGSFSFSTPDLHSDDCVVENCFMEYTTTAPDDGYTSGVDVHAGHRWIIRNNIFQNFYTSAALVDPAVLMWNTARDTIVENNLFLDCERGIYFGGAPIGQDHHVGGIIRNNMFHQTTTTGDVAISISSSSGAKIYHNTVIMFDFDWAIQVRYAPPSGGTSADIRYNVCNLDIVERDGATATYDGNVVSVDPSWFVDYLGGDLHLTSNATPLIDQALVLPEVGIDYDMDTRPQGALSDKGADEYLLASVLGINDIQMISDMQYAQNPVTQISYTADAGTTYTILATDSLQSPFEELATQTPDLSDAQFIDQGGGVNAFDHPSDVNMRFYKISE